MQGVCEANPRFVLEVSIEWCEHCRCWRCAAEAVGPGLASDGSFGRLYLKGRTFPADRTTPDELFTFMNVCFALAQEVERGEYAH